MQNRIALLTVVMMLLGGGALAGLGGQKSSRSREEAAETPAVSDEAAGGESAAIEEEAPAAPDAQETAQAEHYIEDINEPSAEQGDFSSEAAAAVPSNGESPQPPPLSLVSSENAGGEQPEEAEGEILSDDLFPEDASNAVEAGTAEDAPAEVAAEGEEGVEHEAESEVEPESRAAAGEPHDDRDLAELDAELGIEDDEISRMAQELAADDKFDPQHPQHPHAGPETGSHQAH